MTDETGGQLHWAESTAVGGTDREIPRISYEQREDIDGGVEHPQYRVFCKVCRPGCEERLVEKHGSQ